jgi:hypothetical protein
MPHTGVMVAVGIATVYAVVVHRITASRRYCTALPGGDAVSGARSEIIGA